MAKDFYSILGVPKTATDAEIKQSYRKLSRELHPDKHKGDKGKEAKFKEVNEAYEVLSDPKKRQAYDQFGSTNGNPFQGGGSGFSGFGGFDPSSFAGGDFADIFESFFGGGRGGRRREADTRGHSIETEMVVPFMETVTGSEHQLTLRTWVICESCTGTGSAAGGKTVTCKTCDGTGSVTRSTSSLFGMIRQSVLCNDCRGAGKVPEHPCKSCGGDGRRQDRKTVTVKIPAGIDDGQTLRLVGEGEAGRQGAAAGDLLVHIRVSADPRFIRDGDDIRSATQVPLVDAVLGGTVAVDTVHGTVDVSIPAGTQPKQVLRIKGKGMPVLSTSRTGDHFVTIDVVVPTKLSREERKLFEELKHEGK